MKIVNNKTSNCAPISSTCVTWQGGDIPCLEIENGEELNVLVAIIAEKLCELAEPTDLDSLSLAAFLQICNQTEPQVRTLQNILQLMIDNNVCLKELINGILIRLDALEGENTFSVNLGCLGGVDDFGNPIEVDEQQLFQLLITNICEMKSSISEINLTLLDLQNQINNIATEFEVVEPDIATCVDPVSKPTSQQVISVANETCAIRESLGSDADVDLALSRFCNLDFKYAANPNWILFSNITNTAQLMNNLAILACNHEDRITNIEDNCCALTCEDIKLGFSVVAGASANTIVVRFRGLDGTFIPAGFTDCGSTVIITDVTGAAEQYPIAIANEFVSEEIDVSGLDLTQPLTINVQSKLCSEAYTCSQCLNRTFNFNGAGCPVCLITTSAGHIGGTVTIIYET